MARKKSDMPGIQANAMMGHNSDAEIAGYTGEFIELEKQIIELRGKQKDVLYRAKDSNLSKMGIRAAAKMILASEEQRQARQAVEEARDLYVKACKEEGLFLPLEEEAA